MKTVAILITCRFDPKPQNFSNEEIISIKHLKKYLDKYDKYFMVPDKSDAYKYKIKHIKSMNFSKKVHLMKFDRRYFGTPQSFNDLFFSKETFFRFKDYKYLLIYQLDALVFSDQLLEWCNKGYDYISAPWFDSKLAFLTHRKGFPTGGNGGFSLRNIQSCLKVFDAVEKRVKRKTDNAKLRKFWFWLAVLSGKSRRIWLDAPIDNYPFNEDGFWSLEAPKYLSGYKVAPFNEAIKFSFERFPKKCFELNKHKLPFGCHAWERYDKEFWLPYLES